MSTRNSIILTNLNPAWFRSWRRMRRASHEALTKSVVQQYHPIQLKEANILATSLLKNPKDRRQHFVRAGASAIMAILYDYPSLASEHDKSIKEIDINVQWIVEAANPGTFLVEFLPWMLYIPQRYTLSPLPFRPCIDSYCTTRFAKWKRRAWKRSATRYEMYLRLFNRVRADLVRSAVRVVCVKRE